MFTAVNVKKSKSKVRNLVQNYGFGDLQGQIWLKNLNLTNLCPGYELIVGSCVSQNKMKTLLFTNNHSQLQKSGQV